MPGSLSERTGSAGPLYFFYYLFQRVDIQGFSHVLFA